LLSLYKAVSRALTLNPALADEVVPAANDAFVATDSGYKAGKFGLLIVLDAQRALFDARSLLLDRRGEYAFALTELERLTSVTPTSIGQAELRDATGNRDERR